MASQTSIPVSFLTVVKQLLWKAFGEVNEDELEAIVKNSLWLTVLGGEKLFAQGDNSDALFLLVHGRMKAFRTQEDKRAVLGEISPGELIGEMGLISEDARNAEIIATRDCHLVKIEKKNFKSLYFRFPNLAWNISRLIIDRFAHPTGRRRPRKIKNVSFIQGNSGGNVDQLIQELFEVQGKRTYHCLTNSITHSDYQRIDAEGRSPGELVSLTNKIEDAYDLIFYRSDDIRTSWTNFCVRQADEIVIVANANQPIQLHLDTLVKEKKRSISSISVVLQYHERNEKPKNTHSRIEHLHPNFHFHLRTGVRKDVERLNRHLTDTSIGLVLAGGGARGMAHVGVWRALRELDIPVDKVCGTSMGAFLGGIMAFDLDARSIYEIVQEIAYSKPSSDINPIPYVSVIRGKNLDRVLKKYYEGKFIEDCVLPFFCISTDLTNIQAATHFTGDMFKAIRASGSLPGIVPPVPIEKCWHVDGGIIENFPVQQMIEWHADKIIGVSFDQGSNPGSGHKDIPTLKSQLLHGLLKRDEAMQIPSIMEAVMLSTTANSQSRQQQSEALVDVLIRPDVGQYGMLEWKAFEKVVEAGYNAAISRLTSDAVKKLI